MTKRGILSVLAMAIAIAMYPATSDARRLAGETTVSIDKARLATIGPILEEEVSKEIRAGFVAGLVTRDGQTFVYTAGLADRASKTPMTKDTRFRLASMTKPIVTAAVMQLVDRGVVSLADPVSRYIPAYKDAKVATAFEPGKDGTFPTRKAAREITIHDLLTHTGGIGYIFDFETALGAKYREASLYKGEGSLKERIKKIAALPLYEDPGEKWRYSFATDIAAYIIEVATGQPVEQYLSEQFFAPLKMRDTAFFVDRSDFERLATVYAFDENGKMIPAGDDFVANDVNKDGFGFAAGGAGLAATLHDYLQFARMMLRGGEVDGARVLSPSSVRLMMADNLSPKEATGEWSGHGMTFGLGGLVVTDPGLTGDVAAPGDWGWSGYWDTTFVVNEADGIAIVLLAQTQPGPTTPPSRAASLFRAIAYGAVTTDERR